MKKQTNELYDFIQKPAKHKAGRYWKYVSWVILFLIVAFAFSLIYARTIESQGMTRQDRITQYQIRNGIAQRTYQITWK
jgi:hypothetical protein